VAYVLVPLCSSTSMRLPYASLVSSFGFPRASVMVVFQFAYEVDTVPMALAVVRTRCKGSYAYVMKSADVLVGVVFDEPPPNYGRDSCPRRFPLLYTLSVTLYVPASSAEFLI